QQSQAHERMQAAFGFGVGYHFRRRRLASGQSGLQWITARKRREDFVGCARPITRLLFKALQDDSLDRWIQARNMARWPTGGTFGMAPRKLEQLCRFKRALAGEQLVQNEAERV